MLWSWHWLVVPGDGTPAGWVRRIAWSAYGRSKVRPVDPCEEQRIPSSDFLRAMRESSRILGQPQS